MKKFILLLLVLFAFQAPTFSVKADGERYSRVLTDGVMLYIDSTLTVEWFTLPVGYYVKVLTVNHSSTKVEYKSDNPSKPSAKGYISNEHLNIVDEIPSVLYPNLILTVNQNCLMYKDADFSITETVTQNSTLDFYGTLTRNNGEKLIYGLVNTSSGDKYIGYVPTTAVHSFTPPSLPIITDSESASESENESSPEDQTSDGLGNTLQIVIIVAVSIVAISIVYLLFKPAPNPKDEVLTLDDYDE
ncbi:MAG: hypothetical protein IJY84_02850 [Clostridia bacterium]|nr:hypothetical protein [Clostridia bacterium]